MKSQVGVHRVEITAKGDRELVMTRSFDAARPLVFDAFTKPELVRRWLLGPDGWTMPVCEIDLKVGGRYRYVWRKEKARLESGTESAIEMGMGGVFREIVAPALLVATEKFDDAWYPGEALSTLELADLGGRTALTQTLLYESREARDAVLASPMEEGVEVSYERLERLLAGS